MNCDGNEERLEDCEIGNLTSHECSEIGIAHCMNGKSLPCTVTSYTYSFILHIILHSYSGSCDMG